MFKSIDKKFEEIGFIKDLKNSSEKNGYVSYKKNVETYIHTITIHKKNNNQHLIQSYELAINNNGYNNCVGMTLYETKLALKKAKQMGLKIKK